MKIHVNSANAKRWDVNELLRIPAIWIDVWLAENPNDDEEAKEGISVGMLKIASGAEYFRGFEKEAAEIAKYPSYEAFWRDFERSDFDLAEN